MSDTDHAGAEPEPPVPQVEPQVQAQQADEGPTMPLDGFAKTLRLRAVRVPNTAKPGAMRTRLLPGEPDEIWLKLLKTLHGKEKRTVAGWRAAIDALRAQPAWKG